MVVSLLVDWSLVSSMSVRDDVIRLVLFDNSTSTGIDVHGSLIKVRTLRNNKTMVTSLNANWLIDFLNGLVDSVLGLRSTLELVPF